MTEEIFGPSQVQRSAVASASGQKTCHAVAAQVVDPALLLELAHQRVDPREPRGPGFPASEVLFRFGVVDVVSTVE